MNWLLLAGLCIIWGAFLLPPRNRAGLRAAEFERNMMMLSEIQQPEQPGRWVLMPRTDVRFVGMGSRARVRARERRRRVLTVLGEAMAFTALIGAFPQLRPMWFLTGIFAVLYGGYVLLLLRLRVTRESRRSRVITLPDDNVAVLRSRSTDAEAPSRHRAAAR